MAQGIRIKDNDLQPAGYEDYRYSIIDERAGPPFIVWSAPTQERAERIAAYFASLAPCWRGGHPYPLPPKWATPGDPVQRHAGRTRVPSYVE